MGNKTITVRQWWEQAEQSGKNVFGSLPNLATHTGLSENELQKLLVQKITTLREWWDAIGECIYDSHDNLAEKLTSLLPIDKRPYPRRTLSNHITDDTNPKYEEYLLALYKLTALPCFWRDEFAILLEKESKAIEKRLGTLERVTVLGDVFLEELTTLSQMNLSREQKEKVGRILFQIADRIENWQIAEQMNRFFQ